MMFNNKKPKAPVIIACALVAAGFFLVPFWPISAAGIAVAAFFGPGVLAFFLGLLLDLAYGTPPGALHYALFPFTLFAIAAYLFRQVGIRFFFDRSAYDTL